MTSRATTALDVSVRARPHNPPAHDSTLIAAMITLILKSELRTKAGMIAVPLAREVAKRLTTIIHAQ